MKYAILFLSLSICGCTSSQIKPQYAQEVLNEKDVNDPTSLQQKANNLLDQTKELKSEERAFIKSLITEMRGRNNKLTEEGFKIRSVLISQLVTLKSDEKEIANTKARIIEIEKTKVLNTFIVFDKIAEYMKSNLDRDSVIKVVSDLMNERGQVGRN